MKGGVVGKKIGCSGETLRDWVCQAERDVCQAERDEGRHVGATSDEKARIGELEREVRELRQASEA